MKIHPGHVNSEELYRLLAENTTDLICKKTYPGLIFNYISPAVKNLGYKEEEVLGESFLYFIHPEDVERVDSELKEGFLSKRMLITEYRFRKKNGDYVWLETSIKLTSHKTKDETEIICISRDITVRKKMEQQIKAKNEELKTFIYKISHDLRSPITSIEGLIRIAREEIKEPSTQGILAKIDNRIKVLDEVLHSLSEILSIETITVKKEKVNLKALFEKTIDTFKDQEEFQNTEIIFKGGDIIIESNSIMLSTILQNLIQNSIKYRRSRFVVNLIRCEAIVTGNQATITFSDNGSGIESKAQQKVFDLFYRASAKGNGSGLGLYLVKKSVEKLEGEISLMSEPGKGTTFTITLPINN